MKGNRPTSTRDLLPSENRFVAVMRQIGFGRIELLRIDNGEVVLDPWPPTVRGVKFGSEGTATSGTLCDEAQLKSQVLELLEYVRGVEAGEIRRLEVRHGIPFSMEIELAGSGTKAAEEAVVPEVTLDSALPDTRL